MTNRVTCVRKADRQTPWDRIERLSGVRDDTGRDWTCTHQQCVAYIENGYRFYVQEGGHRRWLEVGLSAQGIKFVTTATDGDTQDALLRLPDCRR